MNGLEFIKIHMFYHENIDNLKGFNFMREFLHDLSLCFFFSTLFFIMVSGVVLAFLGCFGEIPPSLTYIIAFSSVIYVTILMCIEIDPNLDFEAPLIIIDSSSLIHEIIHGLISETVGGIKKWEVWVVDGEFWCFSYLPEKIRFPYRQIITVSVHLIHDLIDRFFALDPYGFLEYIKDIFKNEKRLVKELKTKRRKI